MSWQNIVITVCMIAFSYALIPQIIKGFKAKKSLISTQTAFITSAGMFILMFTYLTLNLFFSTIMAFITASLWAILLFQNIIYR